jgi:hypothetical protein
MVAAHAALGRRRRARQAGSGGTGPEVRGGVARQTAEAAGLPAEVARPFDSVELTYRGVTTHAPSLTLVGRDTARAVLSGYREEAACRAFLEEQRRR